MSQRNKAIKLILSFCAAWLAVSCTPGNQANQSKGVLTDAAMNTVTIVTEKSDTLQFSMADVDRKEVDELLLGDTVEVFFQGKYRQGMQADKLVSYPQKQLIGGNRDEYVKEEESSSLELGEMKQSIYQGLLPAASGPGIVYQLTIYSREHSGDGTFKLTLTYKEADNGKDKSFIYRGKRFTQRGIPGNNDATVWECISDEGNETFYFLKENETTLTLLDKDFKKPQNSMNYSLTR